MRSLIVATLLTACQSHPASGLPPAAQWKPEAAPQALSPPPKDLKVDLSRHVRGVIRSAPPTQIADGTAVFVIAKRVDADGKPSGPPLAVRRMTWTGPELAFLLSDANAMIAGTELSGDVLVTAHYDLDGDALTKQPGDLIAQARVHVPADDVTLTLAPFVP